MQPYFFPYIGYFQLINSVDKWIVFDTPQYIRKGWVNRNRILKKNGGVKYFGISVIKSPRETPINEIVTAEYGWREQIINDLDYYKVVKAPYYEKVLNFLDKAFELDDNRLSVLLTSFLVDCCSYLGVKFEFDVFSEMQLGISAVSDPGDWAYEISRSLKAEEYINLPGGKAIFDAHRFSAAGIKLSFLEPIITPYNQMNPDFEPGLSIIDVMMFNSPEQIYEMLNRCKFS